MPVRFMAFVLAYSRVNSTAEGPLVCVPQQIFQGGCQPSVVQSVASVVRGFSRLMSSRFYRQTVGSNYLKAQNKRGLQALVPTVSIYTIQDDIIQPEIINPTSVLPGASSVSVQELCGLTYLADHFTYVCQLSSSLLAQLRTFHVASPSLLRPFT